MRSSFSNFLQPRKSVPHCSKSRATTTPLSATSVSCPMRTTTMQWSSANDAIFVCINIATVSAMFPLVNGSVGPVRSCDGPTASSVRSRRNPSSLARDQRRLLFLSSRSGGPMKPTSSGTVWCHLTCALWLPELKFVDYAKMVDERKDE